MDVTVYELRLPATNAAVIDVQALQKAATDASAFHAELSQLGAWAPISRASQMFSSQRVLAVDLTANDPYVSDRNSAARGGLLINREKNGASFRVDCLWDEVGEQWTLAGKLEIARTVASTVHVLDDLPAQRFISTELQFACPGDRAEPLVLLASNPTEPNASEVMVFVARISFRST